MNFAIARGLRRRQPRSRDQAFQCRKSSAWVSSGLVSRGVTSFPCRQPRLTRRRALARGLRHRARLCALRTNEPFQKSRERARFHMGLETLAWHRRLQLVSEHGTRKRKSSHAD